MFYLQVYLIILMTTVVLIALATHRVRLKDPELSIWKAMFSQESTYYREKDEDHLDLVFPPIILGLFYLLFWPVIAFALLVFMLIFPMTRLLEVLKPL